MEGGGVGTKSCSFLLQLQIILINILVDRLQNVISVEEELYYFYFF